MAKVSTDESKTKSGPGNADAVRAQLSRAFSIIGAVLAAILALGALIVVLRHNINLDNPIVRGILNVADAVSGPFSRNDGIFHFTKKGAIEKNALLNWGIAAIVWLIIGRVASNLVAPKGKRS